MKPMEFRLKEIEILDEKTLLLTLGPRGVIELRVDLSRTKIDDKHYDLRFTSHVEDINAEDIKRCIYPQLGVLLPVPGGEEAFILAIQHGFAGVIKAHCELMPNSKEPMGFPDSFAKIQFRNYDPEKAKLGGEVQLILISKEPTAPKIEHNDPEKTQQESCELLREYQEMCCLNISNPSLKGSEDKDDDRVSDIAGLQSQSGNVNSDHSKDSVTSSSQKSQDSSGELKDSEGLADGQEINVQLIFSGDM